MPIILALAGLGVAGLFGIRDIIKETDETMANNTTNIAGIVMMLVAGLIIWKSIK